MAKSKNAIQKQSKKTLLNLPANSLLDKFGAGLPVPGAGSASALSGLLGGNLAITVVKLTLRKKEYKRAHTELRLIKEDIESKILPRFLVLIDEDSRIFKQVIQARKKRDAEASEYLYQQLHNEALELQKKATLIPIELCDLCINLAKYSRRIYDIGRKAVRGDSGAAFSQSLAGATAALFVVLLNLKSFKKTNWKKDLLKKCESHYKVVLELQNDLFKRLRNLDITATSQSLVQQTNVFHLLESVVTPITFQSTEPPQKK